jgi:hydrogenase-4 component B
MVLLGISGALLHTINHATFKALLFLGAGSVIHSCKTRDIDRMGGVTRRLPWSSACFLIGAVAICGLPPLNGFISELLVYLSAFNGLNATDSWLSALPAISAPALALIGTLAVACFVKVYGIAFLGLPRSPDAAEAHEGGIWMIAPMLILSFVCALIGIFPFLLPPLLEAAAFCWSPNLAISAVALSSLSPLGIVSVMNIALIFLLFSIAILFFRKLAKVPSGKSVTWDCGYLEPTPRMQYTSSSFAEMLTRLNGMFLWTIWHKPSLKGVFPAKSSFSTHVPEAVLELCYIPLLSKIQEIVSPLRRLQHGRLHLYVLYILVTLVLLLFWSNS